jgi:TonB family protein
MNRATTISSAVGLLIVSLAAAQSQEARGSQEFAPGVMRVPHAGIVSPVPTYKVRPTYTPEARQAGVEGTVSVECIVEVDGTVGDTRVSKSLDKQYGLDDQAVKAAKAWRFTAAKDGTEVIRSVVTLSFPFVIEK